MKKERLDRLLVRRGLFPSAEKARRAIMAGEVSVGGARHTKPGRAVTEDCRISIAPHRGFVGRGGKKLASALSHFGISARGRSCLDIGASTGGFTDCLLQSGAARVTAVDVGYGQFALELRDDARVILLERTNARYLSAADLPYRPDLVTIDVSFISLGKIVPAVRRLMAEGAEIVALVKPQFEAGRREIRRGGVVRDPRVHARVIEKVSAMCERSGLRVCGAMESPLRGPAGNVEFFLHLKARKPRGRSSSPRRADVIVSSRMKTIAIVANVVKSGARSACEQVISLAGERGRVVVADRPTAELVGNARLGRDAGELREEADLAVTLGGDGTVLKAARLFAGEETPILGINLGGLGFLTAATIGEAPEALEAAIEGRYPGEERLLLEVKLAREGRTVLDCVVLNDAVVTRGLLSRLVRLEVFIEADYLATFVSDGLIIASPTGSTAHSLSAGGPLVSPEADAIIITPICPHTLSNRPLIIPSGKSVRVELTEDTGETALTLDGQMQERLRRGDEISVAAFGKRLKLLVSPEKNYFQLLREKLNWGGRAPRAERPRKQ